MDSEDKQPASSESKMKQICLQQDVLGGLPNELWAQIVPYLGIRDWGRLEPVSKHFRNILVKYSWMTLETLTVDAQRFCQGDHTLESLEIQCNTFPKFHLSFVPAYKLLHGIANKTHLLISLKLTNFLEWSKEEPLTALGLLPGLSCPTLRKFEFCTYMRSMGAVQEVAQVLVQSKETLTELDLSLFLEDEDEDFLSRATEVLKPVFESLNNLENLDIAFDVNSIGSGPKFNEYLLANKSKLTSLSLEFLIYDGEEYNYFQLARALLESRAKLGKLYLESDNDYVGFLSEYEKLLGSRSSPHPLSSLKRFDSMYHLDLVSDGPILLRLSPYLEEIYGHGMRRYTTFEGELASLISFMGAFLNDHAVEDHERVLQLNLPYSQMYFQEEQVGRLEELTGQLIKSTQNVPCPQFRYTKPEMLAMVPVKVFRKRNASFRLALALH